jgi:HSP20 family protein
MLLKQWEPIREFRTIEDTLGRIWRGLENYGDSAAENWSVPLDVAREGDNLIVHASLPGVDPKHIDVSVEDNVLTIKADTELEQRHEDGEYLMQERRTGSFHRALRLPDTADSENIESTHKNGVLTITIPKAESKKTKQIKVLTN